MILILMILFLSFPYYKFSYFKFGFPKYLYFLYTQVTFSVFSMCKIKKKAASCLLQQNEGSAKSLKTPDSMLT